jgi:hypothetical protein
MGRLELAQAAGRASARTTRGRAAAGTCAQVLFLGKFLKERNKENRQTKGGMRGKLFRILQNFFYHVFR